MENNTPSCPSCQAPLDDLGLCPRCLLAKALEPTSAPSNTPPDIIEVAAAFPDLEVIELIGKGGMGAVYKCRQKSLDRFVALKLLPQSLAADESFALRFQAEAKALAVLNHPNIVTIHNFGHQGGFYFLLMEYVDGLNLRHLIRNRTLSPEEALAIVPPLCEALQFAHERNIVHRDIKPENLLLDSSGRIKIADFGIATIMGQTDLTGEKAAGTPAYMAPEQKINAAPVDARADIYSLGVVLYEMLTGERPDAALTPPSRKATLDVRIDEVVLRALDSQPDQRWQSATELNTRLQTILTDSPSPENLPYSNPKRARWACVLTILSLFVLCLTVIPIRVSESSGAHTNARISILQDEHTSVLAAKKNLEKLAPNSPRFEGPESSKVIAEETAQLKRRADEIQSELDSLTVPISTGRRYAPTIIMFVVLGLGILFSITGLTLGWRHLSWVRGQSPEKPALLSGMIAALLWPLLVTGAIIFALVMTPLGSGRWENAGLNLAAMSAICLDIWILTRVLAWTKNTSHPISKNIALLTFPLIALALVIPLSQFDRLSLQNQEQERAHQQTLQLLQERKHAISQQKFEAESKLTEIEVQSINQTDPAKIAETNALIGSTNKKIKSADIDLRLLELDLLRINSAADQRNPWFSQLLPSILIGLLLASLAYLLIRKARTQQRNQNP